jgi:hypothetical protein
MQQHAVCLSPGSVLYKVLFVSARHQAARIQRSARVWFHGIAIARVYLLGGLQQSKAAHVLCFEILYSLDVTNTGA